ncbi:RNA polymerase sigma factor [Rhodopseudomonas sp. P2A-2r]|uniref:RNA polymerase sigma factor n=1 Tax=Rhodopseudomonas sp. P2A-2r TaxID=2991972 RepID=UPI002234B735|nr:RNA polymerase sigma factor [Rhodopseudomonas sp. P2A-2r]UZE50512.1 RNA polymerase sigma factor [Rhodopseudomonas sp. P2A-2r]
MAESKLLSLSQTIVSGYVELRRRLTRRLGSEELASEVLHETYMRLDSVGDTGVVQRPDDYIFRVALNIANDKRRSDNRRLSYSEVEALYHFAEAATDGEQDIQARSELAMLARAFDALTTRQRAIVIAVRVDGTPHAELARRFGVSERMIDKDLRKALEFCADRLERVLTTRFGSYPPKTSTDK